ncbi:MAG: glycosyltransferase family 4 protein [Bacteroidota bacterium]
MVRVLRVTTVPISLNILLKGQFEFMRSHGFDVITASAEGNEIDELRKREGVDHYIIPLTRKITPIKDLIALWKTYWLINTLKPDIVHTHTPKAGLIGMLAAKLAGVKVKLHTIAGLPLIEAKGLKRIILKLTEKLTVWSANVVYPNSYVMIQLIEKELNISREKLKVLANGSSNGIDTEFFRNSDFLEDEAENLKQKFGIRPKDLVLVFVGRIVKDKGINELVEAFVDLNEAKPNIKLLLIGPFEDDLDPISDNSRNLINNDPSIIMTGFIKDIRPYLILSDIFIFPSYREGFPNVVMQAGCMGLPCIVSNINGCNEIIEEGVNGLIVNSKDVIALKNAINTLLENQSKRLELASNARRMIIDRYDQQIVWKAILHEYKSFLDV